MGLFKSVLGKIKQGLAKTSQGLGTVFTGEKLSEELLDRLETKMIQADFGVKTTGELIADVRAAWERSEIDTSEDARKYLEDILIAGWPDEDRQLHTAPGGGPTVILVAGINGAGKTTSIAKIAKALRGQGKSVLLAACDTFRAAAVEQLEIWSKRLGVEMVKGQQGGDPAAVAFDAAEKAVARGFDVLLVDTAGRLHTQKNLMEQLSKIERVIAKKVPGAPHEVILVLDATIGQNAVNQAREFAQAIKVTGIFLAKLDGTAKGGVVVAIREQLGTPVKFIGIGETPDDVEPFEPPKFVRAMFEG
jgi:fused signal recognition particle receptor